ncbi:co-chaperone GroES [Candidatus Berkelbacteria bacterium CG06_land_8_20_14_3_00_43_10]|uniref:Co-chaperonin GroES n=1 Tax=Candidatus Berkelbacteria bacterium CG10_big_fil_rev_8_21_14_0_10_43_14 TaxID=1974515 RepID=A0A2M6R801_9BACT|nr:MAG: co-chaperone GroES [Candidatus Berkelbacteria bacterium CG2_30_43_20]PIS06627.1 MAG: co-chaperone GroES [Candidatus Berkelbacteria bacterium CG10_big_fil_rev_8_21_14_0_10_43_14]PIU87341.1 MAG: co-chaperone GroES [Candidatus Berkelbacteria bacterium CG06_land_8_20_14_3_00_43_10]
MSKLKPLGDKLLVRPLEAEQITKAGIVLPDSAKEKPQEGVVIAVGSGKIVDGKVMPLEVKVGDTVIYSKYGGDEIKVDGEELKIISESDVLAIVNK